MAIIKLLLHWRLRFPTSVRDDMLNFGSLSSRLKFYLCCDDHLTVSFDFTWFATNAQKKRDPSNIYFFGNMNFIVVFGLFIIWLWILKILLKGKNWCWATNPTRVKSQKSWQESKSKSFFFARALNIVFKESLKMKINVEI